MPKIRLDLLIVERGLAESRAKAQALIMAGQVRVEGEVELKSATSLEATARVEIEQGPRFVSRGGEKLAAALESFDVNVANRICADVGASTGGFTDCLLQHGAAKVYAIDVGKGILHWKLRNDPHVVIMEETNARYVASLPEFPSLVTIDASFISVKILLPVVRGWFTSASGSSAAEERRLVGEGSEVIALIKPQFEAGKKEVTRGEGVIRDPDIHRQVLLDVLKYAQQAGFSLAGLIKSPLLGPKGNTEFLLWAHVNSPDGNAEIDQLVEHALAMSTRPQF
jgi:23S rRNA (cytidine1920-2'-O)/16S rRNA (cytidine1409-2'-O)-methyltransferase